MSKQDRPVALITGGGTGIGRGISLRLATDGYDLLITGRRKEPLRHTAEAVDQPSDRAAFAADLSEPDTPGQLVETCIDRYGRLDLLVNNASLYAYGGPEDTSFDTWRDMMTVNLDAVFKLGQKAIPHLRKSKLPGIINISTTLAYQTVRNVLAYSVSKAALTHLSKLWALELATDGIRVNCICPGVVETPIFASVMPESEIKLRLHEMARAHPLGRIGQPEDVANMVSFLASDRAEWITGGVFAVDGGISLA